MLSAILMSVVAATTAIAPAPGDLPEFAFVFARGEAHVEVAPDTATISFTIEAFERSSEAALKDVTSATDEVLKLCEARGIPNGNVVAYQIDKRAVRETTEGYQDLEILGYEISREFVVTLDSLETYDAFVTALVALDHVTRPSTTFDVSERAKIEGETMVKACQAAHREAQIMARGAGCEIGNVFGMSSTGFDDLRGQFGLGRPSGVVFGEASERAKALFLVPTAITIRKSVSMLYRLQPG